MARKSDTAFVDGGEVEITRPERVLFPDDGFTKGDLISYYRDVGPWMLPYLKQRPLAMERYPDGIDQEGFFQKKVDRYYPDWLRKMIIKKVGGTVGQAICDDLRTLIYLANQACVTPHLMAKPG